MFEKHPITIEKGPKEWQVIPREESGAVVSLDGIINKDDAPGQLFYKVASELTQGEVISWTEITSFTDHWSVEFNLPVGGPYRIELCAKTPDMMFKDAIGGDMVRHVFVGDLYLIAGQSNAVGYARDYVKDEPRIGVSVLRLDGNWALATHPLHDGTNIIRKNLDSTVPAHSPWLACAKQIYEKTGVPVGLIPSAVGGSPMDSWVPGAILYDNALDILRESGPIRGVIWYQGCADAIDLKTDDYAEKFLNMVTSFRHDTGLRELPFFTCQLNGVTESLPEATLEAFAKIRYIQMEMSKHPGIYCLPTAGFKLYDQIHNSGFSNLKIGHQIASMILGTVYDKDFRTEPLRLTEVQKDGNNIKLKLGPIGGRVIVTKNCKKAFRLFNNDERLAIDGIDIRRDEIVFFGRNLCAATRLVYAGDLNEKFAEVHDSEGGWMLAPFDINIQ